MAENSPSSTGGSPERPQASGTVPAAARDDNPYVGPRTFRPDEAARFFGRNTEARELKAIAVANRLTLFHAPSGAGKSSLLNTKIRPALVAGGFELLPVGRVSGFAGEEVEPDNLYIYNLLLSLHEGEAPQDVFESLTLTHFLDNLVRRPDGRHDYDPAYTYPPDAEIRPRVLIVDQFEELVTTNPAYWQHRGPFFEQLAAALAYDEQLWVMLVMREDFIGRLDPYLHLTPGRLRYRYYMERLAPEDALDAIRCPARDAGRPFEDDAARLLVDNLRRIHDSGQREDGRLDQYIEPVQLQAVCYQMWEKLRDHPGPAITVDDVTRFADVETALSNFYEDTIAETVAATGVSELDLRTWFERELITEAGTRNMVFRGEETTGGLPTAVADHVRGQFILGEVVRPGGTWYELVHDRFVGPITLANRAWRQQQPLIQLAQAWDRAGRPASQLLSTQQLERLAANEKEWAALGPLVAEFVTAAQEAQERAAAAEAAAREARRERELERQRELARQQQALARSEAARATEAEAASARQRRLVRIASALALLAALAAIVAGVFWNRARENAAGAEIRARSNRALALSQIRMQSGDPAAGLALAIAGYAITDTLEAEQNLYAAFAGKRQLANATVPPFEGYTGGGGNPYNDLIFSFAGTNSTIRNVVEPREFLRLQEHEDLIITVGLSEGTRLAATGDVQGNIHVSDTATGDLLWQRNVEGLLTVQLTPDGRFLAAGSRDGKIYLFDLTAAGPSGEPAAVFQHPSWGVPLNIAFSPDGTRIAAAYNDGVGRLWYVDRPGAEPVRLGDGPDPMRAITFAYSGDFIATYGDDERITLWSPQDGRVLAAEAPCPNLTWNLALSRDDRKIAVPCSGGVVALWHLPPSLESEGELPTRLNLLPHENEIYVAQFDPTGRYLATGGEDGNVSIWSATTGRQRLALAGHETSVRSLAYVGDGRYLLSISQDGEFNLWDGVVDSHLAVGAGTEPFSTVGPADAAGVLYLASGASIFRWDPATGGLASLFSASAPIAATAYSLESDRLALLTRDGTIELWAGRDQDNLADVPLPLRGNPYAVALDGTGEHVAVGAQYGELLLLTVAGQPEIQSLAGHHNDVFDVAFFSQSPRLAGVDGDGVLHIWDLDTLASVARFETGNGPLRALAVSANDRVLAAADEHSNIRVWRLRNGELEPAATLPGPANATALAFTPGGRLLAGYDDGTLINWDLRRQYPIEIAREGARISHLLVDPAGDYFYLTDIDGSIWRQALTADRALTLACGRLLPAHFRSAMAVFDREPPCESYAPRWLEAGTVEATSFATPYAGDVVEMATLPRIKFFEISPGSVITAGQQVTFRWSVVNARAVYFAEGDEEMGRAGQATETVTPQTTKTYSIIARNDFGEVERSISVLVVED